MKKWLWLLALLCVQAAHAQSVTVTGSTVRGNGSILAAGQWCADQTCFTVTNGTIAAGSAVASGTHTVSIINGGGTTYLTVSGVTFSGSSFNWDSYVVTGSSSGLGVPYMACAPGATYQQTDTGTNWTCDTIFGRGVWTTAQQPVATTRHPGLYAGNGAPTFPCTAPCGYVQSDATPSSANFWDTQAYPGTTTTNWVQQTGQNPVIPKSLVINLSDYPGTDFGAQLAAADTEYAGQVVTFGISDPATCSTPATLSAHHGLALFAPLTTTGTCQITPSSYNTVACYGGGEIINQHAHQTDPKTNAPFAVLAGQGNAQSLDIGNCHYEGIGVDTNTPLVYMDHASYDVNIHNIDAHNAQLFKQQGALASAPAYRLKVRDSHVYWDQIGGYDYDVLIYGAMIDSIVEGNTASGGNGFEENYCMDAGGQPSQSAIISCGSRNNLMANNTCEFMNQACGFGSATWKFTMSGNTSNNVDDVGLDCEGCVNWHAIGNTVTASTNGDITVYYAGFDNVIEANNIVSAGENGISIRNANYLNPAEHTRFSLLGNEFSCKSNGNDVPCTFLYSEASMGLDVEHNHIVNGTFATSVAYFSTWHIANNHIDWTTAIPCSNAGGVRNGCAGIPIPDFHDSLWMLAENNVITSTVAQTYPCLTAGMSASTAETVYLLNNACIGFTASLGLSNSSGTNNTQNFVVHGNTFPSAQPTTSGNVTLIGGGNFYGTSTSAQ